MHFFFFRIFAEETKKIIDNRREDDDSLAPLGLGPPLNHTPMLGNMVRQQSANNLGDRQGDGTTFTFAVEDDKQNVNPLLRQYTSAELIESLKTSGGAVLDDQDKISKFISQLKKGDDSSNKKKPSEFRKKRLTYENAPSGSPMESPQQNKIPTPQPSKEKAKPKRTTIFASSEIGVRQDKKPPFASSLMGTFSCHGNYSIYSVLL